jgi:outer membrane protein assembly factor BamB
MGVVHALNAVTGTELWGNNIGAAISSPAVANGVVYVGTDTQRIYALSAATGGVLWAARTGGLVRSSPAVVNGVVYVGSFDGKVYAYDLSAQSPPTMPVRPAIGSLRPDRHLRAAA